MRTAGRMPWLPQPGRDVGCPRMWLTAGTGAGLRETWTQPHCRTGAWVSIATAKYLDLKTTILSPLPRSGHSLGCVGPPSNPSREAPCLPRLWWNHSSLCLIARDLLPVSLCLSAMSLFLQDTGHNGRETQPTPAWPQLRRFFLQGPCLQTKPRSEVLGSERQHNFFWRRYHSTHNNGKYLLPSCGFFFYIYL